jgi:hypothetical protein
LLILSGVFQAGIGRNLLSTLRDAIGSDRVKFLPFESVEGCGGVLHYLRHDVSPFEPRVILSQSSNDVISVIHPTKLGRYLSAGGVRVTGVRITGEGNS